LSKSPESRHGFLPWRASSCHEKPFTSTESREQPTPIDGVGKSQSPSMGWVKDAKTVYRGVASGISEHLGPSRGMHQSARKKGSLQPETEDGQERLHVPQPQEARCRPIASFRTCHSTRNTSTLCPLCSTRSALSSAFPGGTDAIRDLFAKAILECAQKGIRDPVEMRRCAHEVVRAA